MHDQFEKGRILKDLTTFGIGGAADFFLEVRTITQMQAILSYCNQIQLPFFILGKGSNILFDDRGYRGLVIANRIDFLEDVTEDIWYAGAGYSFSLLGTQTARKGLSGLEFASGIPGSVGGAVYMNAGANGCEACECLLSVDFVTNKGLLVTLPKANLEFSYRYSSFHNMQGSIVGATFKLSRDAKARQKQLEIIHYRKKTQPYNAKSAGCVFRNPVNQFAGVLIEKSGLKGKQWGNAQISALHANFIINTGLAGSEEIRQLIQYVKKEVKLHTGIELESELRFIPYKVQQDESDG